MKRRTLPLLVALLVVLILALAFWPRPRAPQPAPASPVAIDKPVWTQVLTQPVRSLVAVDGAVVLGTYQDSCVLPEYGAATPVAAEPPAEDSPLRLRPAQAWSRTVFALAVSPDHSRVYEGRDMAYPVAAFDPQRRDWRTMPAFPDPERWTVWSLAAGDRLYAGTAKGVWAHALDPDQGAWELLGPPAGQARLPVFSLLYTTHGLYAGTFDGIWRYSGGEWSFLAEAPRGKVFALAQGEWQGRAWWATGTGDGLFVQRGSGAWQRVEGPYARDPTVYSIAWDPQTGALFAGTTDGVLGLDLAQPSGLPWRKAGLSGPIMALAWHDGRLVAGGDGGAFVWGRRGK